MHSLAQGLPRKTDSQAKQLGGLSKDMGWPQLAHHISLISNALPNLDYVTFNSQVYLQTQTRKISPPAAQASLTHDVVPTALRGSLKLLP